MKLIYLSVYCLIEIDICYYFDVQKTVKEQYVFAIFPVASILMASDKETNSVLVTGDADGYIKVWNIHDYCVDSSPELNTNPPGQFTTHSPP